MKKIFGAALAALLLMPLASCSNDNDPINTLSFTIPAYNLYTEIGSGDATVRRASYTFVTTYPANTVQFSTSAMPLPTGETAMFGTIEMPMNVSSVSFDNYRYEVVKFSAASATKTGVVVKDLNGELNQGVYRPGVVMVPGYEEPLLPGGTQHVFFGSYNLSDEWTVRTFWPDLTWRGATVTTYPGMDVPFTSDKIFYRVVMKRDDKDALTGKADVIFYNAKFAPKAPELTVLIQDLDLEFNANGYTVSGADIIPSQVADGGKLQPVPGFKFDNFKLTVSGNLLTGATANYKVAGKYEGQFSGSCVGN